MLGQGTGQNCVTKNLSGLLGLCATVQSENYFQDCAEATGEVAAPLPKNTFAPFATVLFEICSSVNLFNSSTIYVYDKMTWAGGIPLYDVRISRLCF